MAMIETIKQILIEVKALPVTPDQLSDETDVIDEIGLDSIELLNFLLEVEAQLRIRIDFDRLDFSAFHTISKLVEVLQSMPSVAAESSP